MKQSELRDFREQQGWTYRQLVELINAALPDRDYSLKSAQNLVSRWEKGERKMPADVERLLDGLALDAALGAEPGRSVEPPLDDYEAPAGPAADSTPPPPDGAAGAPHQTGGGLMLPTEVDPRLARLCEDLWEMVATGVGIVGAATGSDVLRRDGEIILGDKKALGKAYARLAETNATFRRMLTSMTTSGAWLEVAMVSGMTAGKMMRSHQEIKRQQVVDLQREAEELMGDGDGAGYFGPAEAAA